MTDDKHHSLTRLFKQGGYDKDDYDGQMIVRDPWEPKSS